MREFRDSAGIGWRVWSTIPYAGAVYDPRLRAGWLTFESEGGERRRLVPIPRGWEEAHRERLELMCRAAELARRSGATPEPDAPDVPVDDRRPPPER